MAWKRPFNITIAVAFFVSVILIIGAIYKRYNTDVRVEIVLMTHDNVVKAGDAISIARADFDQPKNCVMRMWHYMILLPFPGVEILIEKTEITTPLNEKNENPIYSRELVNIPKELAAGDYLFYMSGEYYCNMLDYLTGGYNFKSIPIMLKVVR